MAMLPVWQTFPPTYREKEMKILAQWISRGVSCSVVGSSGCGRSNLLDFLGYRAGVLQPYLPTESGQIVLIPIDLNNLPTNSLSTFYRVILRSFYWRRDNFDPTIKEVVTALYLENRATHDPFLSQSAIHELLFAFQTNQTQVVLILNRFDRFCKEATPYMLNTLRGLRDSFKNGLSFVVGMEQAVTFLPDPTLLGDMAELLDSHVCWVGAMNDDDAQRVIAKASHNAPIPASEMREMLTLTGNFPVLLKNIGEWWLDTLDKPSYSQWRKLLATNDIFQHRLSRLWKGLTQKEKFVLSIVLTWQEQMSRRIRDKAFAYIPEGNNSVESIGKLSSAVKPKKIKKDVTKGESESIFAKHLLILKRLADKGLCCQVGEGWQIVGTLLTDYIRRVGLPERGGIYLDEITEQICQGDAIIQNLAPLESKLLHFLLKYPNKPHTYTVLGDEIWPDDEDESEKNYTYRRNDLQMLVSGLRKKIEVASSPRYIVNWRGNPEGGYRFFPEGQPENL